MSSGCFGCGCLECVRAIGAGPEHCLELTALINVRPGHGNRGMVVQDEAVAAKMRAIVADLVGHGEPL